MFFIFVFFLLLIILVVYDIKQAFFWFPPYGMTEFLGVPGAGKTTLAAYFTKKLSKSYDRYNKKHSDKKLIYSNAPIYGAVELDPLQDLGSVLVESGAVIVDEAGIDFNNRNYKNLQKSIIKFVKLFRHYGIDHFILLSQALDMDVTFLRLCTRVCIVYKSLIPGIVFVRELSRRIDLDEDGQIIDKYSFKILGGRHYIYSPPLWKLFDSYEAPPLPSKDWVLWRSSNRYVQNSANESEV